jgi:ribosome-binding protein aMBF1 (putative translation factor)
MPRIRQKWMSTRQISKRQGDEADTLHADLSRMIHDLRVQAGLTQAEFAELIGTKQQGVARLENAAYDGHSLAVLKRIARALGLRLTVSIAKSR